MLWCLFSWKLQKSPAKTHCNLSLQVCCDCIYVTVCQYFNKNFSQFFFPIFVDSRYKCAVCDQGFNTQNLLRSHQLFAHPDYKEFKCNFCEYETSLKSSLNLHIKRKHNITSGPQKWFIKTKYSNQKLRQIFVWNSILS